MNDIGEVVTTVLMGVLFVVVFVLPIIHIHILDRNGKVKPFDRDDDIQP